MLCSFRSFSIIWQWPCTDFEKCIPFCEYGVAIGRVVLELDAPGFCRRVCHRSGEGILRCCE